MRLGGEKNRCAMRRRNFIRLIGGAALWPFVARAQQPGKIHRIGFLTTASGPVPGHEAFAAALAAFGYREGGNLSVERRYAAGDLKRLQALAGELVRAAVDVIVTETTPAALAAKQATARLPIVMATSGDAVGAGVVASLASSRGKRDRHQHLDQPARWQEGAAAA